MMTPFTATCLFIVAVLAGFRYRKVWKSEGPAWQAWLYGTIAAVCLMLVAFVPMDS